MPARNSIDISIPLTLGNGTVIRTHDCHLTADSLEGYTDDAIQRDDIILLDFIFGSGEARTQTTRREYLVTHAHPETHNGRSTTWFMAIPPTLPG